MRNAPDQLTDDAQYAEKFSDRGDKTELATLTRVSNTNMGRQFEPTDEDHPSDYHRARRLAYAGGYMQNREKGEWIKAGIDAAYLAGVQDRKGAPTGRAVFPSKLAFRCIEVELNPKTADATPLPQRVAQIDRLIRELSAYKEQICSRDAEGQEREDRETQTPAPLQVASRG